MDIPTSGPERAKYVAAAKALDYVESGMKLGLGTGSTAAYFVSLLGERVADGLDIIGVPTSTRTLEQALSLNIPMTTLDQAGWLDVVIDGADEFDPGFNLIKGAGGALLQEKIVASAADKMIVISDDRKEVATLGDFTLPVEVVRFGWKTTERKIVEVLKTADVAGREIVCRSAGDGPYITDEGHYILDLSLNKIGQPAELAAQLKQIVGVVETGLFIDLASTIIVGFEDGTTRVTER